LKLFSVNFKITIVLNIEDQFNDLIIKKIAKLKSLDYFLNCCEFLNNNNDINFVTYSKILNNNFFGKILLKNEKNFFNM
jgi:hypothetical protein